MSTHLRCVGIIGSGVMGRGIAAQLANAGIPSLVLDIVPSGLNSQEQKAGLSLSAPLVRNCISKENIQSLLHTKPAPLFEPCGLDLIQTGNMEDDFDRLKEVDWIIEAVPEKVEIKQSILARLETILQPGQIISSNTSGISIREMLQGRSKALRRQFLVTHFFNPPRYMRLLEMIPGPETDLSIIERATTIGTRILGKGIVFAKDTPSFIANRIGVVEMAKILKVADEKGFTVEEVDALSGKVIGRPKSGLFRLLDIIGLDTLANISRYLAQALGEDDAASSLELPGFLHRMIEMNLLGEKTQAGFYRRAGTLSGKEIQVLDLQTFEYKPTTKVSFPCLDMAERIEDLPSRLKVVVNSHDRGGEFVWSFLSATLAYVAGIAPSISDDILNIDHAMKWGFNWELGPFEIWDALGVREVTRRLESEGRSIPALVKNLLKSGCISFYGVEKRRAAYFDFTTGGYQPIPTRPGVIELFHVKTDPTREVLKNEVASLVDLGDVVACIEFHSKMNILSDEVIQFMQHALDVVEKDFDAVLIANQGSGFSAGTDLAQLLHGVEAGNWNEINHMATRFQNTSMRLKFFPKPVVICPHGLSLGGACDFTLHCYRIHAAAETYIGFVETGLGLIPGGGGTKEMVIRCQEHIPPGLEVNRLPFFQRIFEIIGTAKVSGSAREAQIMGILRDHDSWSMNKDCQIHDAKRLALSLAEQDYRPPREKPVRVLGAGGIAALEVAVWNMQVAGSITEYDAHIGCKLAYVLCGGDVPSGTEVTEHYLLDIEREVFLHLCGQPKTQERIRYTLNTGKTLRN